MNYRFFPLLFVFFLPILLQAQRPFPPARPINPNQTLTSIAFGSCNNQAKTQEMWRYILQNDPELWIWMGDNIYADTDDMRMMTAKYQKLKVNPAYQFFRSKCQIIGTWDDHDYGTNDGCKTFPQRDRSKELMLDFLDVPAINPVWKRKGAYQTYTFGPRGKRVRVILLDTRYFRDEKILAPKTSEQRYLPNMNGSMLGEIQWAWLEKILDESRANIHLIISSIQLIPEEHGYEKWADFPKERQRLLDLINNKKPKNPIILSGDRHMAELSCTELSNYEQAIFEITSSGLTHARKIDNEPNAYRVGDMVCKRNYAILKIDWETTVPQCTVEIRGVDNELFMRHSIPLSD